MADKAEGIRLNKYLSEAGICSRRQADILIEKGEIKIDGVVADIGTRVRKGQLVEYRNKPVKKEEEFVFLACNKPRGIVCTTSEKDPDNIISFLSYPKRIFPIGRLDKDSEGLILLTNDGELADQILHARNMHEKEYVVKVNKKISQSFIDGMRTGVPILDTVTRPCHITIKNPYTFHIILTQGLNRQIRRMCEHFGYQVLELKRIRIMNISLGHLHSGGYRKVTKREWEQLRKVLEIAPNGQNKEKAIKKRKVHKK